jgi:hypothetical protein
LLACLVAWGGHWALTCWGSSGSFTYRCFGTEFEFGWGHNSNLVWLQSGQRLVFNYQATIEGACDLTYYVVRHDGLKLRSYAALDIKATGVGNLIFTARDSGLYTLRFTSRQPWKGVIRMSWRPAGSS